MSTATLSVPLDARSQRELAKLARRMGRTPSEAGAQFIAEGVRRSEFANVEFRTTPSGRQAYIAGTRLALWQVVDLLRCNKGSVEKTVAELECPRDYVRTAQLYAKAYPEEINQAIAENRGATFESLSQRLPSLER